MYTPRHITRLCRLALDDRKILVLIGARQTGKSTLARELLAPVPENEKLLLNLDDPFLRDRLVNTEGGILRAIEDKAQRPWSSLEVSAAHGELCQEPCRGRRFSARYSTARIRSTKSP